MPTWSFGWFQWLVSAKYHPQIFPFIHLPYTWIQFFVPFTGFTLKIPDAVMGLTFLAAGGCMPEGISSVLMVRKGEGGVGVSNSLGANSLAILMSLGIPWLIRNILHRNVPGKEFVQINSFHIEYTILLLLLSVIALYVVLTLSRYRLKRTVGLALIAVYSVIITLGVCLELNLFFAPIACPRQWRIKLWSRILVYPNTKNWCQCGPVY